jgi:hypothetical protein
MTIAAATDGAAAPHRQHAWLASLTARRGRTLHEIEWGTRVAHDGAD